MTYGLEDRKVGNFKWTILKLLKQVIEENLTFSLKKMEALVFGISIFFVNYQIIVLIQKLFFEIMILEHMTRGMLILLLGGIQLFCIGLIGEYLARTYLKVKNKPIYIAKKIINKEGEKNDE